MAQTSGPSITARISLEGGEIVIKQLKDIGQAGADAAKQLQESASGSTFSRLTEGFRSAKEHVEAFHRGMDPIRERFREMHSAANEFGRSIEEMGNNIFPHWKEALTLGLAGGVAGFVELVRGAADATREIVNFSKTVGLAATDIHGFTLMAAEAGVEPAKLRVAMAQFARTAADSREGWLKLTGEMPGGTQVMRGATAAMNEMTKSAGGMTGKGIQALEAQHAASPSNVLRGNQLATANEAINANVQVVRGGVKAIYDFADGYRTLGIDTRNYAADEKGNLGLFMEVMKRLGDVKNETVRAAAAQQIFQRGWKEIAPLFQASNKDLLESIQKIHDWGLAIEGEEKHQSHRFEAAQEAMKFVLERFRTIIGNIIGESILPLFEAVRLAITDNKETWKAWAESVRDTLTPIFEDLGRLIRFGESAELKTDFGKNMLVGFQMIRDAAQLTWTVLVATFRGLSRALEPVAGLLNSLFGTKLSGETLLISAGILKLVGAFGVLTSGIRFATASFLFLGTIAGGLLRLLGSFGRFGWIGLLTAGIIGLGAYIAQNRDKWGEWGRFIGKVADMVVAALGAVKQWFFDFTGYLTGKSVTNWEEWSKAVGSAIDEVGGKLSELYDKYRTVVPVIAGAVTGAAAGAMVGGPVGAGLGAVAGGFAGAAGAAALDKSEYVIDPRTGKKIRVTPIRGSEPPIQIDLNIKAQAPTTMLRGTTTTTTTTTPGEKADGVLRGTRPGEQAETLKIVAPAHTEATKENTAALKQNTDASKKETDQKTTGPRPVDAVLDDLDVKAKRKATPGEIPLSPGQPPLSEADSRARLQELYDEGLKMGRDLGGVDFGLRGKEKEDALRTWKRNNWIEDQKIGGVPLNNPGRETPLGPGKRSDLGDSDAGAGVAQLAQALGQNTQAVTSDTQATQQDSQQQAQDQQAQDQQGQSLSENTQGLNDNAQALADNTTALAANAQDIASAIAAIQSSDTVALAAGGVVPGSGSGDTVSAWLTPGEFVVNPRATRAFAPILHAINNFGRAPSAIAGWLDSSFGATQRFAEGGLVMEGGGGGRTPVHLHLDGHQFSLNGTSGVVDALVSEASRHQIRSAGTKPSWYGGRMSG